ncbi:rRNA adenine N-6-methyltransferase family protein [Microlunatus speluncae]|uniref:rRNA adenine N-6-methyltransferase family protein n=1 Tax=Microlunatus speluncae TaxID=2594267 RepID=UPI0012667562|nr:rRNA adenine N-6-methyltransferase family protein [Microlunatus speluncae]
MSARPDPSSFLPDPNLDQHLLAPASARALVDRIEIAATDVVLDLGAGTGVLTAAIQRRRPRGVIAVEPDPRCRSRLTGRPGVDLRPVRIQDLAAGDLDDVTLIIANPPFSALQHVIALARSLPGLRAAYLCTGARWAAAATAVPTDDHYSIVSLEVGTSFEPTVLDRIPGSAFTPPIKVPAAWLRLRPHAVTDPVIMLLVEVIRHRGGVRLKDFLRSPGLGRGRATARLRALREDPLLRGWQQRRLASLSRSELARLAQRIRLSAPAG